MLFSSDQVVSDSSRPHGLQHARLPCPSPSPGVCPSSCPLKQWCHPTVSPSATLFFLCLLTFLCYKYFFSVCDMSLYFMYHFFQNKILFLSFPNHNQILHFSRKSPEVLLFIVLSCLEFILPIISPPLTEQWIIS